MKQWLEQQGATFQPGKGSHLKVFLLCTVQITPNSFHYGQTKRIWQEIEGWSCKGCPSRRKPSRRKN